MKRPLPRQPQALTVPMGPPSPPIPIVPAAAPAGGVPPRGACFPPQAACVPQPAAHSPQPAMCLPPQAYCLPSTTTCLPPEAAYSSPYGVRPSLVVPHLAIAMPAATSVAGHLEASPVESEWVDAIAPTAKRRAAAIQARKEEGRAKLFALLVTWSGAAVFLIGFAILALVVSRSHDAGKGRATPGTGGQAGKPDVQRPGVKAIPPAPIAPAVAAKSGATVTTPNELAPKRGHGINRPSSPPAGNCAKVALPAARPQGPASTTQRTQGSEKRDRPTLPTADQVRTLARSLKTARDALSDYRFDLARSELDKARSLPMWPEHRTKYERLDVLRQHAETFYRALSGAVQGLTPGDGIQLAPNTEVGVVSVAEGTLTVRAAGLNREHRVSELPPDLALAIADQFIEQQGDDAPAFKAAFLITHKKATEAQLRQAHEWWKSAKTSGAEVANLERAIDDRYDLEDGLTNNRLQPAKSAGRTTQFGF
jgi:hypothetical protein